MRGEQCQPSSHLRHQSASYLGHHCDPYVRHLSRGEVVRLFHYDRRRPLAITKLGLTARLPPARELEGVTVHSLTYASPKGGEIPALVAVPKGKGRFRA